MKRIGMLRAMVAIIGAVAMAVLSSGVAMALEVGDYEIKSLSVVLYNRSGGLKVASRSAEKPEMMELLAENADEERPVASLTKMMTVLLVLESGVEMDALVKITPEMVSGLEEFAVVGLPVGDKLSVEELLYATMLPSAGDAAQALAIHISGSLADFVQLMNEKAAALGLNQTHFGNPVGQDQENYSSARDMAKLLDYALENVRFREIFEASEYEIAALGKTIQKTTLGYGLEVGLITGAKTGYTIAAGRCLAATTKMKDENGEEAELLLVVLGAEESPGHIEDALEIFGFYREHYAYRTVLYEGAEIGVAPIKGSGQKEYKLLAPERVRYYLSDEEDLENWRIEVEEVKEITRKTEQGEEIGQLAVYRGEEEIYRAEFNLEQEIEFYSYALLLVPIGVVIAVGLLVKNRVR